VFENLEDFSRLKSIAIKCEQSIYITTTLHLKLRDHNYFDKILLCVDPKNKYITYELKNLVIIDTSLGFEQYTDLIKDHILPKIKWMQLCTNMKYANNEI